MIIKTKKLEETHALGKKISQTLKGGEILKLQGNLGAGKTVFVKGLAVGLKITKPVRSPTFNLMKIYLIKNNKKIKQLVHVDCYRLKTPKEIIEIGLLDYLNQPQTITAIEWPQKISSILKKYQTQKISFTVLKNNERKIEI